MMLHRVRQILTRQRTQISNALRAHMAEFGITAAIGRVGLDRLIAVIADQEDARLTISSWVLSTARSRSSTMTGAFWPMPVEPKQAAG